MSETVETRLAKIEVLVDARDDALRESKRAQERTIAELSARIDRLDVCMDQLAEKLSAAIVTAFEKATEQFASRETVAWWTALFTRGLVWLIVIGLLMIATGRIPLR